MTRAGGRSCRMRLAGCDFCFGIQIPDINVTKKYSTSLISRNVSFATTSPSSHSAPSRRYFDVTTFPTNDGIKAKTYNQPQNHRQMQPARCLASTKNPRQCYPEQDFYQKKSQQSLLPFRSPEALPTRHSVQNTHTDSIELPRSNRHASTTFIKQIHHPSK